MTTTSDAYQRVWLRRVVTAGTTPCGNGTSDAGEQCDDGNMIPEDGCSELCLND